MVQCALEGMFTSDLEGLFTFDWRDCSHLDWRDCSATTMMVTVVGVWVLTHMYTPLKLSRLKDGTSVAKCCGPRQVALLRLQTEPGPTTKVLRSSGWQCLFGRAEQSS